MRKGTSSIILENTIAISRGTFVKNFPKHHSIIKFRTVDRELHDDLVQNGGFRFGTTYAEIIEEKLIRYVGKVDFAEDGHNFYVVSNRLISRFVSFKMTEISWIFGGSTFEQPSSIPPEDNTPSTSDDTEGEQVQGYSVSPEGVTSKAYSLALIQKSKNVVTFDTETRIASITKLEASADASVILVQEGSAITRCPIVSKGNLADFIATQVERVFQTEFGCVVETASNEVMNYLLKRGHKRLNVVSGVAIGCGERQMARTLTLSAGDNTNFVFVTGLTEAEMGLIADSRSVLKFPHQENKATILDFEIDATSMPTYPADKAERGSINRRVPRGLRSNQIAIHNHVV